MLFQQSMILAPVSGVEKGSDTVTADASPAFVSELLTVDADQFSSFESSENSVSRTLSASKRCS